MNSSKRVLLPQPIEAEAVDFLKKQGCDVVISPDPKPETVEPLIKTVQGVILRTGIDITPKLLSHAEDVWVISRTGAGLDNVDVAAATEKNIIVTSNLGVNTSSVVEHVLSLMLALVKQLPRMDDAVRKGNFSIRYQNLSRDLRQKTLGVLGFGRIGAELGRVCRQLFQMRILAHDPVLPNTIKTQFADWVTFTDKEDFFSQADIISVHVPLTANTRHLVSVQAFSRMKPEAIFINTSRGPVVDEAALIEALQNKRIGAAGLDVFEKEPVSGDNPLLKLDNVLLTPHSAALTKECVIRMAVQAAVCVVDVFNGRRPANVANPEVLSTDRWKHLSPSNALSTESL